jgi:hypothetical protein
LSKDASIKNEVQAPYVVDAFGASAMAGVHSITQSSFSPCLSWYLQAFAKPPTANEPTAPAED